MELWKTAMNMMDIPPDTSVRCSYLQIYGNQKIKIQNYIHMINYDQNRLLLQCKTCRVEITGACLEISQYSRQEMTIDGKIDTINFL